MEHDRQSIEDEEDQDDCPEEHLAFSRLLQVMVKLTFILND
jgi:hypothetical protein